MSRRCCFLTMDDMAGYVADDDLAIGPLTELGWSVESISWSDPAARWDEYDIVILRTTWDYQRRPDEFLTVLARIESSKARLENPLNIVKWNLDKRYLRELAARGADIVPTIWDGTYTSEAFSCWQQHFSSDEMVIKPTVSATAENTFRLSGFDNSLGEIFGSRPFMVQPFMRNVVDEGEFSLFYFNGEYSHTILKSPKSADFRVQEEHGGIITAADPEEGLRDAAERVLAMIPEALLYSRVDLVRNDAGGFSLMELELIEPALYLRMDAAAPSRFAAAVDAVMRQAAMPI